MIKMNFLSGWAPLPEPQNPLLNLFGNVTCLQTAIEKIVNIFDTRDYFYSLFQAMNYSGVSPFIATHDYCIKVHCFKQVDTVEMNVSPIYHLGLEYPENYKTKHGKNLDQTAIIGLLEKPVAGTLLLGHTCYSYGIDAGILFKDSNIPHNKTITFKLEEIREGLLVSLSCEHQTSSTAISWNDIHLRDINTTENYNKITTEIVNKDWSEN